MLAYRCSIPAFIQFTHLSHHRSRVAKPIIAEVGGGGGEQSRQQGAGSCLEQEQKTEVTERAAAVSRQGCKRWRAASAGEIRGVRPTVRRASVSVHVCVLVCTEDIKSSWTYSPVNKSEDTTHSSNSQGTERDQHIDRFQGFGFECIFTHTPLHTSQLDLQNSTELKGLKHRRELFH